MGGVKTERSERYRSQRPFTSTSDHRGQDPVSTNPRLNACSSCLLLPYMPPSAQPHPSCLHLPSAGVKGVSRATTTWLFLF